jgi:hypothetical protein
MIVDVTINGMQYICKLRTDNRVLFYGIVVTDMPNINLITVGGFWI